MGTADHLGSSQRRIFSIGHSTHAMEEFLHLLHMHGIEMLVDVRSHPASRWSPHFTQKPLKASLSAGGIKYLYLGKELGGKPANPAFYDEAGHVLYGKMAATASFGKALDEIESNMREYRLAIMCGEEDPTGCHRRLLVGRALARRQIELTHIRGNGEIQLEADLELKKGKGTGARQLTLFPGLESSDLDNWKSPHTIPRKGERST